MTTTARRSAAHARTGFTDDTEVIPAVELDLAAGGSSVGRGATHRPVTPDQPAGV